MINITNLSLTLSTHELFADLAANFQVEQKIGVVGRNGAGKSTLLKVIAGKQPYDSGTILIDGTKVLAYMPQDVTLVSHLNVLEEVLNGHPLYKEVIMRSKQLERYLDKNPDSEMLEEYAVLHRKLTDIDEHSLKLRAQEILKGLGFSSSMLAQSVDTLSVGWKMRVVLAQLLLNKADFYLFDEPTNHLDIASKEWFFNFLRSTKSGYLLVSHDRYFLDKVCDYIYEIERGKGHMYTGSFTAYIEQKEQRRTILQATYERQQKEISKKQATIDRFKAKATKAKMAHSMQKQLDRLELVEIEPPLPVVSFSFPAVVSSGSVVLRVQNVKYSFNTNDLFSNVSFEIGRGQKIAIVAPNGTGKTTLLNIIVGKLTQQKGSIELGYNVTSTYFEQDQARALDGTKTIFQTVRERCSHASESTIRSMLGSFLFSGDAIDKTISVLSGGEKNRVAMVIVLLSKANFLVLDEPTNHLDLYSKQILLEALKHYTGTILFVSHDQSFIQDLATHILELTPQGSYLYSDSYQDYCARKTLVSGAENKAATVVQANSVNVSIIADKKELFLLRKKVQNLETKITRLERQLEELQTTLGFVEFGTSEYQQAESSYKRIKGELAVSLSEWEELQGVL